MLGETELRVRRVKLAAATGRLVDRSAEERPDRFERREATAVGAEGLSAGCAVLRLDRAGLEDDEGEGWLDSLRVIRSEGLDSVGWLVDDEEEGLGRSAAEDGLLCERRSI